MFLIRDIFRCKPGKAGALAKMFLKTVPSMESEDGFRNCRVMTDYVATYWPWCCRPKWTTSRSSTPTCAASAPAPRSRRPWRATWIWWTGATGRFTESWSKGLYNPSCLRVS